MAMGLLASKTKVPGGGSGFCPSTALVDDGGLHYPDESCTGVSNEGALVAAGTGDEITVNNQTYENKEVDGCLIITGGTATTVRNVRIITTNNCVAGIYIDASAATVLIEDVEIDCSLGGTTWGDGGGCSAIRVDSAVTFTATRINAYGGENGTFIGDSGTVQDSYFHDHADNNEAHDTHVDAFQVAAGVTDLNVLRNTIFGSKPPATVVTNTVGSSAYTMGTGHTNVLIQGNLIAGGQNCLRNEHPGQTNVRGINNRFAKIFHADCGSDGNIDSIANFNTWTGNAWYEDGVAIN